MSYEWIIERDIQEWEVEVAYKNTPKPKNHLTITRSTIDGLSTG